MRLRSFLVATVLFAAACGPASGQRPADAAGEVAGSRRLAMFYLDVTKGRVMTADAEQPTPRVVVSSAGQGPDGIAVDAQARHIYWTGMGVPADDDGFVRRSDLEGAHVTTLVPAGGTFTPKQMRLDLTHGKMYWSDREGMRVQRANLDGSEIEAVVVTGEGAQARKDEARWCVGLALDVRAGLVYWSQKGPSNGGVGSLRRAPFATAAGETAASRTDVEILYDRLPEPVDIDLDPEGGYLYWTDRGDDTINRAPLTLPVGATAATRRDRQVLVTGVREAIGIALDLAQGKAYFTSGANGDLGRVNLDGSGRESLVQKPGNLTGIALAERPLP